MNKNELAIFITQCEVEIKKIVQDGIRLYIPKQQIKKQVDEVITKANKTIIEFGSDFEKLAVDTTTGLKKLFLDCYNKAFKSMPRLPFLKSELPSFIKLANPNEEATTLTLKNGQVVKGFVDTTKLNEFLTFGESGYSQLLIDDYKDNVDKAMLSIAENRATLLAKNGRRLSLRNLAEMTVRYDNHLNQMERLNKQGVELVVISEHSNASKRCSPWQGRVYSLNGKSGYTNDKYRRKYIPLEVATKSGLFSYNCRHRAVKYLENMELPKPYKADTIKKERAVEEKQRAFERSIRYTEEMKILDANNKKKWNAKSRALRSAYKTFSKDNNVAYYPNRTEITLDEAEANKIFANRFKGE